MKRFQLLAVVALLLAGLVGCGSDTHGTVEGEVNFAGSPLKEGVIRFVPVDGNSQPASALIVDGKFTEKVAVGTHNVTISSPKLPKGINSSKEIKRGTIDEGSAMEELIPARYNDQTKLQETIKPGVNPIKFNFDAR